MTSVAQAKPLTMTRLELAIADFSANLSDDQRHKLAKIRNVPDAESILVFTAELDAANSDRRGRSVSTRVYTVIFQSFTARSTSQNAYIQDLLLQQSKRHEQRRKERLLDKLSTHRPEKLLKQNQRKRFCNTANWVFQPSKFHQWVGPGVSHLWLSGKISSGKSVLIIIDRLFLEKSRSDYLVSYFFISSGDQDSLNAEAVMRSILRQRLPKASEISDELVTSLQKLEYDNDLEEIIDLLRTTTHSSRVSYIIVDGLDECGGTERSKLFKSLSSLAASTSNTKLLLASRESLSTEIKNQFSPICSLSMSRSEAEGDITSCIDAFLKEKLEHGHLKIGDSRVIDEIRQALIKGVDGMLLWLFFRIQDICRQYSDDDICQTIASLPKTLEETYHRLLCRIESENHMQKCQQVFAWVSGAMRLLSVTELREAIAIKIGQVYTEKDRLCNAMDRLISSCENLVRSHSKKVFHSCQRNDHFIGEICMTYLDFNDFKTTLNRRQRPIILPEPLETAASAMGPRWRKAVDIVNVIRAPKPSQPIDVINVVRRPATETMVETNLMKQAYPFLRYASVHWISHSKNFQPGISHIWGLFKRIIVNGHAMATLPWPLRDMIASLDVLEWTLKCRHYGLLGLIFEYNDELQAHISRTMDEAIYTGDGKLIDFILVRHASIKDEATEKLVLAIQKGSLEITDKLLLSGADVNAAVRNGAQTALQVAAERGCLDIVERLLEANAEVNRDQPSPLGCTALQVAAKAGNLEVVGKLLAKDAVVIARCGCTALQAASECGHLEIVQRLLEVPETFVNTRSADDHCFNGRTALQLASEGGHLEVVRSLLAANAHVDTSAVHTFGSYTVLQAACRYGYFRVVKTLIEAGADVHSAPVEWGGRTAFEAAAMGGNIDVLRVLLATGAHATLCGPAPRPGIKVGDSDMTTGLLEFESELSPDNRASLCLAVDTATRHGHLEFIKMLFTAGADANGGCALPIAAGNGYLDIVEFLVDRGADINYDTAHGTALASAANNGYFNIVRPLVKSGAIVEEDTNCSIELTIAAQNKNSNIVRILLQNGATIHQDADHGIVLLAVVEEGYLEIIDGLIGAGADVNVESSRGTALRAAVRCNASLAIIVRSINAGANFNAEDANPHTALDIARLTSHMDHYKRLQKAGGRRGAKAK